jgi:hypothetical protein
MAVAPLYERKGWPEEGEAKARQGQRVFGWRCMVGGRLRVVGEGFLKRPETIWKNYRAAWYIQEATRLKGVGEKGYRL